MADDMRQQRARTARAFEDARRALGLTQEQVAVLADVSAKTVYSFESRTQPRWPNAKTRARLEKVVGWAPGEIERRAEDGTRRLPELDAAMLARLRELDPAERARLIEWLKAQSPREANGGTASLER